MTSEGISVIGPDGSRAAIAGPDEWYDIAYGDGRLFATRSTGDGCDLVDTATGDVVMTGADAIARIDRSQGFCELGSAPGGGLLFGADNGSLASTATYHLDLDTYQITLVAPGYGASAAINGSIVALVHRYFARGGSYEQPWLLTAQGTRRSLARAPSPRSGPQFGSVAISRNGGRVAATSTNGVKRPRGALVFGSARGRLTSVAWRLQPGRVFAGVSWSGGDTVVAGVLTSYRAETFSLYSVRLANRKRSLITSGVKAFATG